MKRFFAGFCALTLAIGGWAAEYASLGKIPGVVRMETPADGSVAQSVSFPAVAARPGTVPVLRLNARIVSSSFGWNNYLALKLNGRTLGPLTADGSPRLLRRGNSLRNDIRDYRSWWRADTLLTFFAPEEGEAVSPHVHSGREEGYNFYLNVADALHTQRIGPDNRVESDGDNKLEITFSLTSKMLDGRKAELLVKDLEIVAMTPGELRAAGGSAHRNFVKTSAAASVELDGTVLSVGASGGIMLTVGGEEFFVESRYSYVARPAMKFHNFPAGKGDWLVSVKLIGSDTITVVGEAQDYCLTRTLRTGAGRISVTDKIENKSSRDLGMAWEIALGQARQTADFRLAGQSNSQGVFDAHAWANPSIFYPGEKNAAGIVAEDAVSRAQLFMTSGGNSIAMGSESLGIAAKQSVTLEWAIYPQSGKDYFTMVNAVRRNWKVNHTVPGSVLFTVKDEDIPRLAYFDYVMVTPWFEYWTGLKYDRPAYTCLVQEKMAAMRKVNPKLKFYSLVENNLIPFNCKKHDWASSIILNPTGSAQDRKLPGIAYGQPFKPAINELIEKYFPFADSAIRNEKGMILYDNYYAFSPHINILVQPESGNSRERYFFEQADYLIDTVGFDGFYADQFRPNKQEGISHFGWDNHSVELNPDGTVKAKLHNYAISGSSSRRAIIDYVRKKGVPMMVNGQPVAPEEQALGELAFQEMGNDRLNFAAFMDKKPPEGAWPGKCHFGSPILLGQPPASSQLAAKSLVKGIIYALRNGCLYFYYDLKLPRGAGNGALEVGKNMYPFTPEELHEGWLKGKERTITAVSGCFGVYGQTEPKVLCYDLEGNVVTPQKCRIGGKPGAWQVELALQDYNEVAILIAQDSQEGRSKD